jgi:hypothetical protein
MRSRRRIVLRVLGGLSSSSCSWRSSAAISTRSRCCSPARGMPRTTRVPSRGSPGAPSRARTCRRTRSCPICVVVPTRRAAPRTARARRARRATRLVRAGIRLRPRGSTGPDSLSRPRCRRRANPFAAAPAPSPSSAVTAALARAFGDDLPAAEQAALGTRAVVVLRDGQLVAERYAPGFTPTTRQLGWSMAKSVTNLMLGRLVAQGQGVDHRRSPAPGVDRRAGEDHRRAVACG